MIATESNALSKNGHMPNNSSSSNLNSLQQSKDSQKDRTLFCINIDQKCTEDILYELFLQVFRFF
jgi:hypothetical protein